RYTTVSGDSDSDGIAVASSITLNGGTIKDAVGNSAGLSFSALNTTGVLIDNTAPTAALTYSPASSAKSGSALTITATFNEAMADSPVPQFSVSGANTGAATAMTKIDATHYTGSYVVGAGSGTATVSLSTGTDVVGNPITPAPTSGSTFTVDNTAPTASIA